MSPGAAPAVQRAGAGKFLPDARGTGIATTTNFDTFGIWWATPVPLREQNLVLGPRAGTKVPVRAAGSGTFLPQTQADPTLSFDHRVLDGVGEGRLLARTAPQMGAPETL